jgi:hypothetical protein
LLISKVTDLLKVIFGFFKGLASALGLFLAYRKGKDDERQEILKDNLEVAAESAKDRSSIAALPDDVLDNIVFYKPKSPKS